MTLRNVDLAFAVLGRAIMDAPLDKLIDRKLNGALTRMAKDDARTPALQLLWLAQTEAQRRGLLQVEPGQALQPAMQPALAASGRA
jgi:hypothetical protein